MSLKDKILKANDLPYEDVEVPEWGGVTVRIRGLTAGAGGDLLGLLTEEDADGQDWAAFKRELLAASICDPETDEVVFDDGEALDGKSLTVVNRLFRIAQDVSGLGGEPGEEMEGN